MPVKFVPTGSLDITTNPSLLPQETDGKKVVSGAMRRCTNLRLDETGRARTRFGSTKGSTAISAANLMLESGGYRYEFGGTSIYKDETAIASGLTNAQWDAVVGRAWNESADNIYAVNGTDRKRITSGTVYEWGIAAPTISGSGNGSADYMCTYDWEEALTGISGTTVSLNQCDATTGFTANEVPGATSTETISLDTSDYVESTGSVKCVFYHPGQLYSEFRLLYNYGSAQDWSSYEQISLWFKFYVEWYSSQVLTASLYLVDDDSNTQEIVLGTITSNTWTYRIINTSDITLDLTKIQKIGVEINTGTVHLESDYFWIDDIVGYASGGYTPVTCVKFTNTYDTTIDTEYTHFWERQTMNDEDDVDMMPTVYTYRSLWWWELSNNITKPCWIKYTYARRDSSGILVSESNPSPAYQVNVNATQGIAIYPPPDSSVTHARLYRTNFNGESTDEYYFDSEWNIGIDAISIQTMYDNELATLLEDDHDRPPLGAILAGPNFLGHIFMAKDHYLYYCKPNQPEYWPLTYYVEVGSPDRDITGLEFWNGNLYAMKKNEIYLIAGTGHGSFLPTIMRAKTGVKQHTLATSVKGAGIFRINGDGIYVFTLTNDERITSKALHNIFYGESVENIVYINETYLTRCFLVEFKNKIYFFYVAYGETYAGNIIVFDMDNKRVCHFDYGTEFTAACVDYTNDKLYACDSTGYIWELEAESATTDNAVAIDWQIQSKVFSDTLYKYFPRYAKYDVDVVSGTAYGYILLNETIKQTHEITGSRNTKKRLVTHCTGDRLSLRLAGSGTVSIYGAEVE
jgi:hypothetical protein